MQALFINEMCLDQAWRAESIPECASQLDLFPRIGNSLTFILQGGTVAFAILGENLISVNSRHVVPAGYLQGHNGDTMETQQTVLRFVPGHVPVGTPLKGSETVSHFLLFRMILKTETQSKCACTKSSSDLEDPSSPKLEYGYLYGGIKKGR